MTAIIIIIVITSLVSILGFYNPNIMNRLALWPYQVARGKNIYQLFSHMLVHGGYLHLIINMYVFYQFATLLYWQLQELAIQGYLQAPLLQVLIIYIIGGGSAALFSVYTYRNNSMRASVGASGGVCAILFSSILFAPWMKLYLFGLIPMPAIILGAGFLLFSWKFADRSNSHIDHRAHLYGSIFGLLYPFAVNPRLFMVFIDRLTQWPF